MKFIIFSLIYINQNNAFQKVLIYVILNAGNPTIRQEDRKPRQVREKATVLIQNVRVFSDCPAISY
jgi:hypothetical protein